MRTKGAVVTLFTCVDSSMFLPITEAGACVFTLRTLKKFPHVISYMNLQTVFIGTLVITLGAAV